VGVPTQISALAQWEVLQAQMVRPRLPKLPPRLRGMAVVAVVPLRLRLQGMVAMATGAVVAVVAVLLHLATIPVRVAQAATGLRG